MFSARMIPRRRMLAAIGAGAAVGLLAACGGGGSASTTASGSATTAAAATSAAATSSATSAASSAAATTAAATSSSTAAAAAQAPAQPGAAVSFLCRPDIVTAYGAEAAVKAFNQSHPGTTVTLQQPPQGVDVLTKVRAAIASDSLVWDGYAVMVAPWDTATWVEAQVIQPMDALINTSREPDASKIIPGAIPTIADAIKYQGKTYCIPGNVGSVALQWFWEPLKGVGFTQQPATWDDTMTAATKIKSAYPKWTPFAQAGAPLCGLFALMWAAIPPSELFTSDGIINLKHQGAVDAMNWMRQMVNNKLMLPTATGATDDFSREVLAMILCYDVVGEDAQKTYGYSAADTGINIFPKAGVVNSGTPFWMNSSVIFNKAKNPQGLMDFYIWWFGPSNAAAQQTLVATAAKPCYQYTYDKYIASNSNFAWETTGIALVGKSAPAPANTYFELEQTAVGPWQDKFLAPGSKLTAEQALQGALQDVKTQIQAQQG